MNKKEIANYVAKQCNYPQKKTREIIDTLFYTILEFLNKGEDITFRNFGHFYLKEMQEKRFYNPNKKTFFTLPKHTRVKFSGSKKMQTIVKRIEVK
jgi:nucleoid DNA-binding protein